MRRHKGTNASHGRTCPRCGVKIASSMAVHQKRPVCIAVYNERRLQAKGWTAFGRLDFKEVLESAGVPFEVSETEYLRTKSGARAQHRLWAPRWAHDMIALSTQSFEDYFWRDLGKEYNYTDAALIRSRVRGGLAHMLRRVQADPEYRKACASVLMLEPRGIAVFVMSEEQP